MAQTVIVPLVLPEENEEHVSALALPVAGAIAARNDAKVVLMTVIEAAAPPGDPAGTVDAGLAQEQIAYLQQAAQELPGGTAEIVVRQGLDVAGQICNVASSYPNAVIVISSHTRRGIRRAVLGSVALEVVNAATVPVVVIPDGFEPAEDRALNFETVLVPVDNTPGSDLNIDEMLAVLGNRPLDIHLQGDAVSVAEAAAIGRSEALQIEGQSIRRLDRFSSRLSGAGHQVTWEIAVGEPDERIILAARDIGAGIIAMTTRGLTGVRRIVLGSVAEAVLRDSGLPIILTRYDEAGAQG